MKLPRPLTPMLTLAVSMALVWLPTQAQAVAFGNLNVTPRGAQNLNLETGATDMPTGGTATDSKSGLVLTGSKMTLKPNESLTAQGATLKTKQGGTLNAGTVIYDLKNGTATATGNVTYSDARVQNLKASSVVVYIKSGFVVAQGSVQASKPSLSGTALAFDPATMQAAISGPFALSSAGGKQTGQAGEKLLLTFAGNTLVNAKPRPTADDLARFSPYLK